MHNKKCIILLLVLLHIMISIVPVNADATLINKESGYRTIFVDEAELFSSQNYEKIIEKIQYLDEFGNVILLVVSNNTYTSSQGYAERFYKEHFGNSSGIVFIMDVTKKNIGIYKNGNFGFKIPDGYENVINDKVQEEWESGDYNIILNKLIEYVIDEEEISNFRITKLIDSIVLAVNIAFVGNFIFIMYFYRRKNITKKQRISNIDKNVKIDKAGAYFVGDEEVKTNLI